MNVMPLAEAGTAAREAAAAIPVVERSTHRRRNSAGAGAHLGHTLVSLVAHDDPGRVAGQPLGRSGRNAHAVFELRLSGLTGVSQDGGVHVRHPLVALRRRAGIEALVERGLGKHRQRVGLLLRHGRCVPLWRLVASPLVEGLPRRIERFDEHSTNLCGEPTPDLHHAVFVLIHVQRPAGVLASGLLSLGLGVHASPGAHDALDVLGGTSATHGQQLLLGLGRGHTGQLADLRVREHAACERLRHEGKVPRARATRTSSRAAPGANPTPQESQAAHERKPFAQPPRASNSRMRSRSRAVAASRCAERSAISSPIRSRSVAAAPRKQTFIASLPSAEATLQPNSVAAWKTQGGAIERAFALFSGRYPKCRLRVSTQRCTWSYASPAAWRGRAAAHPSSVKMTIQASPRRASASRSGPWAANSTTRGADGGRKTRSTCATGYMVGSSRTGPPGPIHEYDRTKGD